MKNFYLLILFSTLTACNSPSQISPSAVFNTAQQQQSDTPNIILDAESNANPAARAVMQMTRQMAEKGEIIRGGCWDYLNTAWTRAGYPAKKRQTIFKGKYKRPPYANPNLIQAGDWLYYVNHSYNDVEHSGMFITWTDRSANEALIFSYAGENRSEPARYRVYQIDQVYNIMRAK